MKRFVLALFALVLAAGCHAQIPPSPPVGFTGAGVADLKLPDYQPPIVALLGAPNGMNFHAYIVTK